MKKQKETIIYSLIALLVGFLLATAVARIASSRITSSSATHLEPLVVPMYQRSTLHALIEAKALKKLKTPMVKEMFAAIK